VACPFYRRSHPGECRAVAGEPGRPPQRVAAALCRGAFERCAAYGFVRAAGKPVNRADFDAWVVRGIEPGRAEPAGEPG
jgi:hypothetical protein